MAATFTEIKSINDYQKGVGYNRQRLVLDAGSTSGIFIPSDASKIKEIHTVNITTRTASNPFTVVYGYSSTEDREVFTVAGVADASYEIMVTGRVA